MADQYGLNLAVVDILPPVTIISFRRSNMYK
jgi:hypothetical protein